MEKISIVHVCPPYAFCTIAICPAFQFISINLFFQECQLSHQTYYVQIKKDLEEVLNVNLSKQNISEEAFDGPPNNADPQAGASPPTPEQLDKTRPKVAAPQSEKPQGKAKCCRTTCLGSTI